VEELDRLRYLTLEMKRDLLLSVNHDVLAAALRLSSKEMIMELLGELTESMREEFLEKLDVPKPALTINKAQDQVMKVVRDKEKNGEIVLDPQSFVKYV
jgi:flagellar motor switch protein FliG